MAEQVPFDLEIELAPNPEPRCPCVLLLDVSRSMAGSKISLLNEGIQAYRNDLNADSLASQRVEVALVTFGGEVEVVCPFVTASLFQPPTLKVHGDTPMGRAVTHGIEMVGERKQFYKEQGLHYFRPWIFLVTDGGPTDEWKSAAELVRKGEQAKSFAFFAVGVEGANFDVLRRISVRQPLALRELRFRDLFVWLSQSQRQVSVSSPGEEERITFANPTGPGGWASL
jgi:uncharacterized protein YegL